MENKGLIFLDIIIGLFILGLIVVMTFPTVTLINKSFEKSKEITDMTYLAEYTMENLRVKDERALGFLEELEKANTLKYDYLEDENYISNVELLDKHPSLWNLSISISKKDVEGEEAYVEIKASIPK